jgi:type 2 lantibiotic biosynthesis protein LanM
VGEHARTNRKKFINNNIMQFHCSDVIEIVKNASSIADRLARYKRKKQESMNAPVSYSAGDPQTVYRNDVAEYVEKWQHVFDDDEYYKKRLQWDDVDDRDVVNALSSYDADSTFPLPRWGDLFQEWMQWFTDLSVQQVLDRKHTHQCINKQAPVVFEDICLFFVLFARRKLIEACGEAYATLTAPAQVTFERALLQILSRIAQNALYHEFSVYRLECDQLMSAYPNAAMGHSSCSQYIRFVTKLLQEDLCTFFKEYSVLCRLMFQFTDEWMQCTKTFICRLKYDWYEIKETLGINDPVLSVITVKPYLSDLHNGGYSVVALTLSSGHSLVYKPQSMGMAQAYYTVLKWFNTKYKEFPFRIVPVIDKGSHGWMEYVAPSPCRSVKEVHDYYVRSGMLLCIAYFFYGKDFHCENIIACREHPVVVDLETLVHPDMCSTPESPLTNLKQGVTDIRPPGDTVLRTDFLPQNRFRHYNLKFDMSGLSASPGKRTSFQKVVLSSINSDEMRMETDEYCLQQIYNIPQLPQEKVDPEKYAGVLVDGFQRMFTMIDTRRDEITSPDGPLSAFDDVDGRFIYRPSWVYTSLISQGLHPDYLRNGIDRSLIFERLYRTMLLHKERPLHWGIIAEEIVAIDGMNVPHFRTNTNNRRLRIHAKVFEDCMTETGYHCIVERFKNIRQKDIEDQIALIRSALTDRPGSGPGDCRLS